MGDELPACHGAIPSEIGSYALSGLPDPESFKVTLVFYVTVLLLPYCVFETLRMLRHHLSSPVN